MDGPIALLKLRAQKREDKLSREGKVKGDGESGKPAAGHEDAGPTVHEHSDTWGFSWMPVIETFVEQAASPEVGSSAEENVDGSGLGDGDNDGRSESVPVAQASDAQLGRPGRKRRRPGSPLSRDKPRPPSYNETLLADKAFHNPHASETMADAYGIIRPASFVIDVDADARSWGGAPTAPSEQEQESARPEVSFAHSSASDPGSGGSDRDRSWFYDTVRDRQNRLWADSRIKKGVELARKGQHQAAVENYTQALGMCPDHDDGLVARGAAYATTGRLRQAVQDLSRALSLNPRNENAASYLKETRRRMERHDTRESPRSKASTTSLVERGGPRFDRAVGDSRLDGGNNDLSGASVSRRGESEEEGPGAALTALLQDGAEGSAIRKMRALLEDDCRRRRERKSLDGRDAEESRKKKAHKKDKKSKGKRSSSSHHKRDRDRTRDRDRDRRRSTGGTMDGDASEVRSSSDSNSDDSDSREKKKKKHKRKHKRKARTRSASPSRLSGVGAGNGVKVGLSPPNFPVEKEDSAGEAEAHPILQRKKHRLWG